MHVRLDESGQFVDEPGNGASWHSRCREKAAENSGNGRWFECLARLEGDSSNALFDTLQDWNTHLKSLKGGPQGPSL